MTLDEYLADLCGLRTLLLGMCPLRTFRSCIFFSSFCSAALPFLFLIFKSSTFCSFLPSYLHLRIHSSFLLGLPSFPPSSAPSFSPSDVYIVSPPRFPFPPTRSTTPWRRRVTLSCSRKNILLVIRLYINFFPSLLSLPSCFFFHCLFFSSPRLSALYFLQPLPSLSFFLSFIYFSYTFRPLKPSS